MREFHRVKEDSSLARDTSSGAIIRTDLDAFNTRKAKKLESQRLKKNDERLEELERKVEKLEAVVATLLGAVVKCP